MPHFRSDPLRRQQKPFVTLHRILHYGLSIAMGHAAKK